MSLTLRSTLKLNDGRAHPHLGFGVWQSPLDVCKQSVVNALTVGYRCIDTAQGYKNEAQVGEGVREFIKSGKATREEIWVTTKMGRPKENMDKTLAALKDSVEKIGLGYVDLFLIHAPADSKEDRALHWSAMQRLQKQGLAKSIGVSNYEIEHLEEIKDSGVVPAINQIELHPFSQERALVDYCKKNHIVLEAYSPINRGKGFDNAVIQRLSRSHGVDPGQVLIRWSLQKGFIPLPKSDQPKRIQSNSEVFEFALSSQEVSDLDALG